MPSGASKQEKRPRPLPPIPGTLSNKVKLEPASIQERLIFPFQSTHIRTMISPFLCLQVIPATVMWPTYVQAYLVRTGYLMQVEKFQWRYTVCRISFSLRMPNPITVSISFPIRGLKDPTGAIPTMQTRTLNLEHRHRRSFTSRNQGRIFTALQTSMMQSRTSSISILWATQAHSILAPTTMCMYTTQMEITSCIK